MKHCPNPECGGIAKFKIISEFNDSAETCSDCGTSLVQGPAPRPGELGDRPAPDPNIELVPLLMASDKAQLIFIEEALDMAGIPYMAKGEEIQDLFGFGRMVAVNPLTGPVEIYVTSTDADAARKAVAEILG